MKAFLVLVYILAICALVLYFRRCAEHFVNDCPCSGSSCNTPGQTQSCNLPPYVDTNPPPVPPPPPPQPPVPPLVPPFSSNIKIKLKDPASKKYVTYNGANFPVNADSANATVFTVQNNPSVYGNSGGGVALQTTGGPGANNGFARHAGYILWSHGFAGGNYDFSWKFNKLENSNDTFVIYNWFGGGTYLDIANGNLQISGNSGKQWIVERVD